MPPYPVHRATTNGMIACASAGLVNQNRRDQMCNLHSAAIALLISIGYSSAAHAEWVRCADENRECVVPAVGYHVRYGASNNGQQKYYERVLTTQRVTCSNQTFGDPWLSATKHCDYWRN